MNGGRPRKIEINSSDSEIITLINHINENILIGKNDIKEKAKHLCELAKDKGYYLAESEIKNKFFGLFKKNKSIFLSKEYINRLSGFLTKIKDEYNLNQDVINNFKYKYAPDEIESVNSKVATEDILSILFENKLYSNHLDDTEWIIFERIGDEALKDSDWGIAVGRIKFNKTKKYLCVAMDTVYKKINRTYQGVATQDSQKCLFIDLIKFGDNTRSNIVLQLADSDVNGQDLMIGHYSFYSPSSAYDHILSKTIVLLKVIHKENANHLIIGNYNHLSAEYRTIPQEIISFLYHREINRMSMPKEAVSNLFELNDFLKNHRFNKINPILRKHFINQYTVYYKRFDGIIVEDHLNIYYDNDAIKLIAKYTHKPDMNKKHNKNWAGQIFINESKSGISLEFSNEKSVARQEQEDPILLSFWIPDLSITFYESQCYPGVISGLEDSSKGPISFICIAVKKDIDNFQGIDDLRIKNFFNQQEHSILQPKAPKFTLDSFK